jgi:hypothetical protein
MRLDRYALWIAIWDFFQGVHIRQVVPEQQWDDRFGLLDQLWQDERKDAALASVGESELVHLLRQLRKWCPFRLKPSSNSKASLQLNSKQLAKKRQRTFLVTFVLNISWWMSPIPLLKLTPQMKGE